jgi:hypothetical protein
VRSTELAVYEVGSPDYGLHGVGDHRVVDDGALHHLLEPLARPTVAENDLRTRWARMRVRSPSRKLRVAVENQFGDPVVEDRVAENSRRPFDS